MAASTKSLFRATKPKPDKGDPLFEDLPQQEKPGTRDPLDYDPTPPDATAAFLEAEQEHILKHPGPVWETAVGGGHIARVLAQWGHDVVGSDIVDRGWSGTIVRPFYSWDGLRQNMGLPPACKAITNPPYNEVSARDGHGRWLLHCRNLGLDYVALLLNADWPAARKNGFDALLHDHPPSIEYLCCWKIDFRCLGAPPQRNSWFVWDTNRPALGPNTWIRKRLYRDPPSRAQKNMEFDDP